MIKEEKKRNLSKASIMDGKVIYKVVLPLIPEMKKIGYVSVVP